MNNHPRLFNQIAFAYRKFFNFQKRMFLPIIEKNIGLIGALPGDSFLDIGCGTGALMTVLTESGFKATGVDAAPNMVNIARKAGANCAVGNIEFSLPYKDATFDFVIASFVAHGLEAALRIKLYAEARRLVKKAVIIHDYYGPQTLFTEFVERLEGGDYFSFMAHGEAEFKNAFSRTEILPVTKNAAWYVGYPV